MKRTFERILFMTIGALIAFFAYAVGNADRGVDAEDVEIQGLGKIARYEVLIVNRALYVGDPQKNSVLISADNNNGAAIFVTQGDITDEENIFNDKIPTVVMIGTAKNEAAIQIKDHKGIRNISTDRLK